MDIVYPKICLVCKKGLKGAPNIDNLVCAECWGRIKKNLPPFCHSCGRHLNRENSIKNICLTCLRHPLSFDRAFGVCQYEGVIRELIHAFKYAKKDYLGFTLSRLMIEFIKEYDVPIKFLEGIIPVPLHKARLREREFNQAQILCNYIGKEFNLKVLDNILIRQRYTKTQTELENEMRFLNVKDSFLVNRKEPINGKNFLLVDDVLTTGATCSEAAGALKKAGAGIVFVLTLAN